MSTINGSITSKSRKSFRSNRKVQEDSDIKKIKDLCAQYELSPTPVSAILILDLKDTNTYGDSIRNTVRNSFILWLNDELQNFVLSTNNRKIQVSFTPLSDSSDYFWSTDGNMEIVKSLYVKEFQRHVNAKCNDQHFVQNKGDGRLSVDFLLTQPLEFGFVSLKS